MAGLGGRLCHRISERRTGEAPGYRNRWSAEFRARPHLPVGPFAIDCLHKCPIRGINSVVVLLTLAFITVLLAWLGWWDNIVKLIPYLSVHMNTGFYLVFSTGLMIIWLMMFFLFDRLTFWRVRPGQMVEEHLIGGGAESFDSNGLRFQKHRSDFFRAALGLGAGDLMATVSGSGGTTIEIPNVIFVDRKIKAIEKLIAVKPDHAE